MAPDLIHDCPYSVRVLLIQKVFERFESFHYFQEYNVKNFTYDVDLLPLIMPSGDYKLISSFTNREGVSFGNMTYIFSVNSIIKQSWR